MRNDTPMVIDCQTCPVRQVHCADCMVSAMDGFAAQRRHHEPVQVEDGKLTLDAAERRAVDVFVDAGLVDPIDAATFTARREPWSGVRAVG